LKFSKRRRAVPLRTIWTIMVAAKLDQSRVLVTKFRQNRLTLKGRSVGQRHTDRQTDRLTDRETNSAKNNGPSGLQSGQQACWFLRPDCAPISECLQFGTRNDADATFVDPHIISVVDCRCRHAASTAAARYDRREVAGMANFIMYLLRRGVAKGGGISVYIPSQNQSLKIIVCSNCSRCRQAASI